MNLPDESFPISPYEERLRLVAQRLRRDMIAVRLEVRPLAFPPPLVSPGVRLRQPDDRKAVAHPDSRETLDRVVQTVKRFQHRACRIWQAMTLPFPTPRVRLVAVERASRLDGALSGLCEELRHQLEQPSIRGVTRLCFPPRHLSGVMVGPTDAMDFCLGCFGIQWDYPSLEPDPRLASLSPSLHQEELDRVLERFRDAAEQADTALLVGVVRLTKAAMGLLNSPYGTGDCRRSSWQRLARAFLRLRRLNTSQEGAIDRLLVEAHRILKKARVDGHAGRGLRRECLAATLRWIESEFLRLSAENRYPLGTLHDPAPMD